MATYTLSYTGAQVNAAIGNATNLYNGAHTWTATQTHTGNIVGSTGATLDFPVIAGASGTFQSLTIEGGSARVDIDVAGGLYDAGAFQVASTGTFTVNCSASFGDDLSVAGSATVTGDLTVYGDLILTSLTVSQMNVIDTLSVDTLTASDFTAGDAEINNSVTVHQGVYAQYMSVNDGITFKGAGTKKIEMFYTSVAIASAAHDGFYLDSGGLVNNIVAGDPIIANALVFYWIS